MEKSNRNKNPETKNPETKKPVTKSLKQKLSTISF